MFILEHLGAKIRCSCFQGANRLKVQSFTRDRVFTFSLVMFSIINQLSKSLSVELTKFLQQFCPGKMKCAPVRLSVQQFVLPPNHFGLGARTFSANPLGSSPVEGTSGRLFLPKTLYIQHIYKQ